jgi:hypothetical protein
VNCRRAWIAALVALSVWAPAAPAQTLTIVGNRFAVDRTPRFLVFISYFGAMGAPRADADLAFLRRCGFDGVRIWPTWTRDRN